MFNQWLDTFIQEKGINLDEQFEVEGAMGTNYMQYYNVVAEIKTAPKSEQDRIKDMIVAIDFANGDVKHFFRHLAQAIAI